MELMMDSTRTSLVLWAVVVVFLTSACAEKCGHEPPPTGLEGAYELVSLVPADANFVIYGANLGDLLDNLSQVEAVFPWQIPIDGDRQFWEGAGVQLDGPALIYLGDRQWVVLGWIEPEARARTQGAWDIDEGRQALELEQRHGRGWRQVDEDGQWQSWMATDGRRVAAGWAVEAGATPLDEQIWRLGENHRRIRVHKRALLDEVSAEGEMPVHGVLRGQALLARLGGQGRAAFLRDMVAEQVGEIFWAIQFDDDAKMTLDLLTPGQPEVPVAVADLGEARGDLPDLGGLARPGVPAILRFSADPERLVALLRSTLSVDDRNRFDESLQLLREDLRIDVEADVIDNLTGQVAVVIYGLEDRFFELEGMELIAGLTRLDLTREAVLLPFEDRERMEAILNAWTQMSRGNLRRQVIRHTIQYAWFDDGVLKWAVILTDEHLLILDSGVAFGYASSWERSPQPFSGVFEDRGVGTMLEARRGLAAYLDLTTLRSILREGESSEMADLLDGLDAIRIETDVDGVPHRTRVELWSTSRQVGGDEEP